MPGEGQRQAGTEIPSCPGLGSGHFLAGLVCCVWWFAGRQLRSVLADSFSAPAPVRAEAVCPGEEEGCQDCSGARGEQPPVSGLGAAAPARLWKLPPRLHATAWNQIAEHGAACLPFRLWCPSSAWFLLQIDGLRRACYDGRDGSAPVCSLDAAALLLPPPHAPLTWSSSSSTR